MMHNRWMYSPLACTIGEQELQATQKSSYPFGGDCRSDIGGSFDMWI